MISPLQVSILFTLVETRGGVPADRWSLFQRHYNLLRDREAAKEGDTAKLLREYASQIDQIHYDAGFLLHVRAESAGSADAYIDEQELRSLLMNLLEAEGYDKQTIGGVTRELVRIATDRLVLLGSKVGGRISFDVRSLQEFMAAARIMSSPEQSIQDRLREISGKAHWRHVLRIAASKAFALTELSHFRKNIIHVCDALDKGDLGHADQTAQSGARFALDLLIDNVAARLPEMRRALASRALEILRSGPRAVVPQLGQFLDQDTKQVYETSIVDALSNSDSFSFAAAIKLLVFIINYRPTFRGWAERLFVDAWPTEPKQALNIARQLGVTSDATVFVEKLNDSLLEAGVVDCLEYAENLYPIDDADQSSKFSALALVRPFVEGMRHSPIVAVKNLQGEVIYHIKFQSIFGERLENIDLPKVSDWHALTPLFEFMRTPTRDTLANIFREAEHLELYRFLSLPWPVKLLLEDSTGSSNLAAEVEAGAIGDVDDWRRAEERWVSLGVSERDLISWTEGDFREIAVIGSPTPTADHRSPTRGGRAEALSAMYLTILERTSLSNKKLTMFQILSSSADLLKSTHALQIVTFYISALTEGLISDRRFLFAARSLPLEDPTFSDALQTVNKIGQNRGIELFGSAFPARSAIDLLKQNPSLRGLLPFVLPMRGTRGRTQYTALQRLPAEFFEYCSDDKPAIKALVFVLRTAKGMEDQVSVEDLIERLLNDVPKNRLIHVTEFISSSPYFADDKAIKLVDLLCERMRRQDAARFSRLQTTLKSKLDSRHSRLNEVSVCSALSLPSTQSLALPK